MVEPATASVARFARRGSEWRRARHPFQERRDGKAAKLFLIKALADGSVPSRPCHYERSTIQASDLRRQSGEQLVQRDRIVTDADSASVVDGVCHGRPGAADAEFADALAF